MGQHLPPLVGAHFGHGGIATGFVTRERYLIVASIGCVLLPLIIVFPISIALRNPKAVINLPHREYWLAPERRPATVEFIRQQMMRFGTAMLVFVCYIHWLVVQANERSPPRLAGSAFVSAVAVFIGFIVVWIAIHYTHFRRPAGGQPT